MSFSPSFPIPSNRIGRLLPGLIIAVPSMTSKDISGQTSILTVILSSSVVLAVVTGLFYFLGGAYYIGYSQALGLNYLAGLQPAEYVFLGAQQLLFLVFFFASFLLMAWLLSRYLPVRPKPVFGKWEPVIFFLGVLILTVLLGAFTASKAGVSRDLITSSACPLTGNGSSITALLVFLTAILVMPFLSYFFSKVLRGAFLVWGVVACVLCLYNFGWAAGAEHLYGKFQTAKIMSLTAQLPAETDVLLLGRDDKNLVVLVSGENSAGHPEQKYFLRSEVKMFRLVGESSIDAFFCKKAVK